MTDQLTKREWKELIRESVVPILPDQSLRAHLLAFRLFFKWGIVSFLCGKKRALLTALDPVCRFLPINKDEERLAAEQLTDFAEAWSDCLFFFLPLTEKDRIFADRYASSLTCRMIVSTPQALLSQAPSAPCPLPLNQERYTS